MLKIILDYIYRSSWVILFSFGFFLCFPIHELKDYLYGVLNWIFVLILVGMIFLYVVLLLLIKKKTLFNHYLLIVPMETFFNMSLVSFSGLIGLSLTYIMHDHISFPDAIYQLKFLYIAYFLLIIFLAWVSTVKITDIDIYHNK